MEAALKASISLLQLHAPNPRLRGSAPPLPRARILTPGIGLIRAFLYAALVQGYFGYSSFRPYQREIIQKVLDGRDCLVAMATGSGKSIW